jgi:hypothetical protein
MDSDALFLSLFLTWIGAEDAMIEPMHRFEAEAGSNPVNQS